MRKIDLNADLGEGSGSDKELLQIASSANIACGGHAGSPDSMRRTIDLALAAGKAVGAHPGYEDREHFGRRPMHPSPSSLQDLVLRQLEPFMAIAEKAGATLHHVKAHGALYHEAGASQELADAFTSAVNRIAPRSLVYAQPSQTWKRAAELHGMGLVAEAFADRRYLPDASLMPRDLPGAIIVSPEEAAEQALRIASRKAPPGNGDDPAPLLIDARTICVHGDSPNALACLEAVHAALQSAGFSIAPP